MLGAATPTKEGHSRWLVYVDCFDPFRSNGKRSLAICLPNEGALRAREQVRILDLLIERIEFDGQAGNVAITFRPTGIRTLAVEAASDEEVAA